VQKALYPEGAATCHAIVLHPPSGIVAGDELEIDVHVGPQAHALLTTPGAGKWYRSGGPEASQRLRLEVAEHGVLEWLPQETIVFDGARACMDTKILLGRKACFIGWEILCLGRRAGGERFDSGEILLQSRIEQDGRPLWLERGKLEGGSNVLESPAGLAGYSVSATLLAVGSGLDAALLTACREIVPVELEARYGITLLPEVLVARYLGHASESAREWFGALWKILRPALIGCEASTPRIWNT
jgi:urease accessory protein